MSEMEKFFTREVSQEGKKIPLSYPDGSESPHWVVLRGIDSDAYKTAFAKERTYLLGLQEDGDIDDGTYEASKIRLLSSCIASWSFDDDPTPENVAKFFKEAPQVTDRLDRLIGDRKFFFAKEASGSKRSPRTKPS